jgi:SAM-dependent methyltransferase
MDSLGKEMAEAFDKEMKSRCEAAFTGHAWKNLLQGYTGKWSQNSATPTDNAVFGSMGEWLNQERSKTKVKAESWDKFRNSKDEDSSPLESLLKHISLNPKPTGISLTRIMDFGCGDAVELAKVARGLGLGQSDVFGVDIRDYVSDEVDKNVTFLLAPDKEPDYGTSLQQYLDNYSLRGTVSAVFSQVTFHHITMPEMRTSAISFIRDSLAPGGFFLLAEWDNVGVPIDFSIYFDLEHYLPQLYFSDPAPTDAKLGPLDTEYLSVQGWIDMMSDNGIPFNSERSRLPWTSSKHNTTEWLDPVAAATKTVGRNFMAVFAGANAL